jgi:HNH endonuclease
MKNDQTKVTHDLLLEDFIYDKETGVLSRRRDWSNAATKTVRGALQVFVRGAGIFTAHRVIWFWVTGAWPDKFIDHINGDPTDNRWDNLRLATNAENLRAKRAPSKAASGLRGAHKNTGTKKFRARITVDYKPIHLGYFDTREEAHAAYQNAARKYFGEFAST